jgi:hypothetical protein
LPGGGGGGGGGYGGGGGGQSPTLVTDDNGGAVDPYFRSGTVFDGGGGGSYVNPSASDVKETGGVNSGNGLITIAYIPPVPPTFTGVGGTTQVDAGATTSAPFAGLAVDDSNRGTPTDTLTIRLSDPNATLDDFGVPLNAISPGVYELTGTSGQIDADIFQITGTSSTGVVSGYTALTLHAPSTVTGAVNGVEKMTISFSDTSSLGGATSTAMDTVDILAPPPTISGAGETYTTAGASTDTPFAGVTVGDLNAGATDTLTVTLSDANATLAYNGHTLTAADPGVYTLTGSAYGITGELDALTLNAPATLTGAVNGVEVLSFSLSDASSGYPGSPATATATADIVAPAATYSKSFATTGQIQTFTAQSTGYYDITADGAQGGSAYYSIVTPSQGGAGGLGAMASGDVYLKAGATLEIVVGAVGGTPTSGGGGGGGGSFVIETNNGSGPVKINEVIAGGGGGGAVSVGGGGGSHTPTGGNGGNGLRGTPGHGGVGGAGGAGGQDSADTGGGGGGFTGGAAGEGSGVGIAAQGGSVNGVTFAGGYTSEANGGYGGFGGGGQGGYVGGGGGGGYGGGGGGAGGGVGGGGGSFVAADALDGQTVGSTHSGTGSVTIAELAAPTILVASPATHSATGQTPVDPFAGDAITDTNIGSPTETLSVTPSASADGVLSDPNSASDHSTVNPTTGVFTVTGTADAVTAALDGLVFTPSAGATGTTTKFTISDTSNAYPLPVTDSSTSVTDNPPCYCTGTRILTERGEVAVEDLKIGDHVITHSNHSVPIKWIGHRELNCERHPAPESVWPVVVRADAFGAGMPSRDLWLSPGHNVVSEGVLIPISALRNGRTVEQVRQPRVGYWHIELDTHDIIVADGLPAESYLDTGNRCAFSNGGAFIEQHPDFRPKHWAQTCLPLVHEGNEITQSRRLLLERAAALGHVITSEDDLHIIADQRRIEAVRVSDTRRFFALPEGCQNIRLRSRQFVPAQVSPDSGDWRELGICVGRLQIDGQDIALDQDEAFTSGWHDVEQYADNFRQRWTDGAAKLPAGCRLIVIDIAGRGYYWSEHYENNVVALFGAQG